MQEFNLYFSDSFQGGEETEIEQNLKTLFSTREGSQPAERDFGINWSCLDEDVDLYKNKYFRTMQRLPGSLPANGCTGQRKT